MLQSTSVNRLDLKHFLQGHFTVHTPLLPQFFCFFYVLCECSFLFSILYSFKVIKPLENPSLCKLQAGGASPLILLFIQANPTLVDGWPECEKALRHNKHYLGLLTQCQFMQANSLHFCLLNFGIHPLQLFHLCSNLCWFFCLWWESSCSQQFVTSRLNSNFDLYPL